MMNRPSRQVEAIRSHLQEIGTASWIDGARRWWPSYLFHCTDIRNVVSILKSGELLSRAQVNRTSSLEVDIAGSEIVAQTDLEWQEYVRLYFRPRTPTQFRNEGFRPRSEWAYNAHCPVPVYLLFDSVSVLSMESSHFTDGNAASSQASPAQSIDALRQIPFQLVYHDSWFDPDDRDKIVYHRNAEVLIPQRLALDHLRIICCRSQAEYETLLYLLAPSTRRRWVDRIGVQPQMRLFNNRWTFVERADMSDQELVLRFNKGSQSPGPFDARLDLQTTGPKTYYWRDQSFQTKPNNVLRFSLANISNADDYVARFFLDEQLAFASRRQVDYLPF